VIQWATLGNIALYKGFKLLMDLLTKSIHQANPFAFSSLNGFREKVSISLKTLASAIQIGDLLLREGCAPSRAKRHTQPLAANESPTRAAMADRTGMYTCPYTGWRWPSVKARATVKFNRTNAWWLGSTAHGLPNSPDFAHRLNRRHLWMSGESELANPPVYLLANPRIVHLIQHSPGERQRAGRWLAPETLRRRVHRAGR